MRRPWICLYASLCLLTATAAYAHPVPFSYLDVRVRPSTLDVTLVVHVFDAGHDLDVEPPERLLDPATLRGYTSALQAMLAPRLTVAADGHALTPVWQDVEPIAARQSLRLRITYAWPADTKPGTVLVSTRLFPYDPQHQTFLNIYEGEGEALTQAILDARHDAFEYFAGTRQGTLAVIAKMLPAGIHHILIGPDHILFLIGLLLTGGSLRQLALIVTAFTIAHSLTLSLAALNLVSPPERLIEPAIALSIIYVGADNLLRDGGRDMRMWIAFGFGFIHGFGFANVLREMELPQRALAWSLLSFNLGVEVGQLLIVGVVASALAWVRLRSASVARQVAYVGSIVVIVAGACWFIQRVFFPGGHS